MIEEQNGSKAGTPSPERLGSPLEVWSFGCIGQPGHYLRDPNGHTVWDEKAQPWGWKIDGTLCEGGAFQRSNGKTWEHHKNGWSAVAFWDQSGDRRIGSCTVFLVHADADTQQILAAARTQWPQVWNRAGFPLANNVLGPTQLRITPEKPHKPQLAKG